MYPEINVCHGDIDRTENEGDWVSVVYHPDAAELVDDLCVLAV